MNNHKDDKKLEQLFLQLRQQDEQRTPAFARMWTTAVRAKTETRRRPMPVFRFAFSIVLLLVIAGSAFIVYRQKKDDYLQRADSITRWQAPTRSLLTFSHEKMPRNQHLLTAHFSVHNTQTLSNWRSPTAALGYPGKRRFKRYHKHLL